MTPKGNSGSQECDEHTTNSCCPKKKCRMKTDNLSLCEDSKDDDLIQNTTDKGWAWMICAACFVITLVMSLYDQVLAVMFVDVVEKFNVSVTTAAAVFTVHAFTFSIGSVISTNIIIPKCGDRVVIVIAGVINSVTTIIIAFSPGITFYLIFHVLKGLSIGSMWIPALGLLGHYFVERRSLATSITNAGIGMSLVVAPPFIRELLDKFGFSGTLLIISGVEMQAIIMGMLLRPTGQHSKHRDRKHTHSNSKSTMIEKEQRSLLSKTEAQYHHKHDGVSILSVTTSSDMQLLDGVVNSSDALENTCLLHNQEHQILVTSHADQCVTVNDENMGIPNAGNSTQSGLKSVKQMAIISEHDNSFIHSNSLSDGDEQSGRITEYKEVLNLEQKDMCSVSKINTSQLTMDKISASLRQNRLFHWLCPCKELLLSFDFKLLNDWRIQLLLASTVFGALLQYIPAYIPTLAVQKGVTKASAAVLLTVCGCVNLISSLLQGLLIDSRFITASTFIIICQIIVGTMCHFTYFFTSFPTLLLISITHGMFGGARMSLMPVVAMDFVGVKNLSKALGFNAMMATLSLSVHHPFLGYLLDVTNSFTIPFHYVGFALYVSSCFMLMENFGRKLISKRQTDNFK